MRTLTIKPVNNYYCIYTVLVAVLVTVAAISLDLLSGQASAEATGSSLGHSQQGDSGSASESSTFCNPDLITIPGAGAATPYPSRIEVSGLRGPVGQVKVTLNRLRHDFYDDIDILLVGPAGQSVLLMSDVGDSCNREMSLTFGDRAAPLPDFGCPSLSTDVFSPSNYPPNPDGFPAPAPAPPYGDRLSVFNRTNPNGTWTLYAVDDYGLFSGRISGGWCLNIAVGGSQ